MTKKEIYEKLSTLAANIAWTATLLKTWGEHYRDGRMLNEGQLLESISRTTKEWSEEFHKD